MYTYIFIHKNKNIIRISKAFLRFFFINTYVCSYNNTNHLVLAYIYKRNSVLKLLSSIFCDVQNNILTYIIDFTDTEHFPENVYQLEVNPFSYWSSFSITNIILFYNSYKNNDLTRYPNIWFFFFVLHKYYYEYIHII